jgi:hypothetical protein
MSDTVKIDNEMLKFEFSVAETNAILSALGQLPYIQSANIIGIIHAQAGKQVEQILAKEENGKS